MRLAMDWGLSLAGALDLRFLVAPSGLETESWSLAGLAEASLGELLDKSPKVVRSNWAAPDLSPAQVRYAAKDAQIGLRIARRLISTVASTFPPPASHGPASSFRQ